MKLVHFIPLLVLATRGEAAHFHISGRHAHISPHLVSRTSMTGSISQLGDSQNLVYLTNVTLNDAPFSIMIDTGSSDIWVSASVPNAVPEQYQASVTYASGSAAGNVMSATLGFAGFSVPSQFYIEAPQATAAGGADGLIGLGPSSGSNIRALGGSAAANPPLDRIFTSNASLSPQIAVLLQRSDDPEEPYPGDLSVGEVLTDYQDILNQPHHPVTLASLAGGQHWQTLLDVNGITGPNGQPIQIKTQVTGVQTKNATVIFDTGFTLPQVPSNIAQALYGEISGAVLTNLSNIGEIWVLPCDQQVNATFFFGGVEFPIHPLDLNFDGFDLQADGKKICVGSFQPYTFDIEQENEILFDMILGMAFLRNSYILINFGNLVNAATPSTDTAYIQLLPVTNATQAAQDFAKSRNGLGGATADEIRQIFGSNGSSTSTSKPSFPRWLIALIAGIGALAVLIAGIACCCCRRRRIKSGSLPRTGWRANRPNYQQISEPSPQAAFDMYMPPGASPGRTHVPEYSTTWDAHY